MSSALNENQILEGLKHLVNTPNRWAHEGRKLIFWYDPEGVFSEVFENLELGIEKLKLGDRPFYTKYHLLIEKPQTDFLLYAPFEKPADKDNWLLDLELSGNYFSADQAAMIFRDFGFHLKRLELYIREHLSFFNNKRRYTALHEMGLSKDADEAELRLGMMSVLVGLKIPDATLFIRKVLLAGLKEKDNKVWQELLKYFSADEFWDVVNQSLAYSSSNPGLRQLALRLAVTHMSRHLGTGLPESLREARLGRSAQAYVFMDSWLRHAEDSKAWPALASEIAKAIKVEEFALTLEPAVYNEVETFKEFDEALLRALVLRLGDAQPDYRMMRESISRRKTLFWFEQYKDYYAALEAATDFFELLGNLQDGFKGSAVDLFKTYSSHLFKIDQAYRHYVLASDRVSGDILKQLDGQLEAAYTQRYLDDLLAAWSKALKEFNSWGTQGLDAQWHFYSRKVFPFLASSDREKAFVIISDGLRYEVAEELRQRLIKEVRGEAYLSPMLSILPSRTNFGMAALLPGQTLSLSEAASYTVLKDGKSTQGSTERQKLLSSTGYEAVVLSAEDLLEWSRERGREATRAYRLIYIYHDVIDKTGENAERDVFEGCEKALEDLLNLIKRIVNSFNGTNVFLTSDHGFLYQRRELEDADKIEVHSKADLFELKRRHALGHDAHAPLGSIGFELPYLENDLKAFSPVGNQRYAIQGAGAQYVHGGVSLQEVSVPLLHYKHVRASKGDEGPSQPVGVQVIANTRRVTNTLFNLRLLQQEAVAGRMTSRRISLAFYDQNEKPVTNIVALELDKTSEKATEREQVVRLTVESNKVNRAEAYFLVIKDIDDGIEILRESWTISLAFSDDFGDF